MNIKVTEAKCILISGILKPTKGHNSNSYGRLASILVHMKHTVIVDVYTRFQLSSFHSSLEICYENFQEWQNYWKPTKGYNSKSYGPLAPIPVYT